MTLILLNNNSKLFCKMSLCFLDQIELMHSGQEYPRSHVVSFSVYHTLRGTWCQYVLLVVTYYCCWDSSGPWGLLVGCRTWRSSLSFALGRRKPCGWGNACLQALPGPELFLVLTLPPCVMCTPKPRFLLRIRPMTVMHAWVSASPPPIKTALVSTGPGLVQKLTLTWLFERHLLASCLFPWNKATVKSTSTFPPVFFLQEPVHSVPGVVGSCLQESLFWPGHAGSSLWLGRSSILPALLLAPLY